MRTIEVPVEPLTVAAFAPYGAVIETGRSSADFEASPNRMINLGFEVDGHAELHLIRYQKKDMIVTSLERHLTMTEARVSLGEPAVIVVAEKVEAVEQSESSNFGAVRAFLLRSGQGLMFKRGIWHSLDCYPIVANFADFAFFTEREAEEELSALQNAHPEQCIRSQIVNIMEEYGTEFLVTDPKGIMKV